MKSSRLPDPVAVAQSLRNGTVCYEPLDGLGSRGDAERFHQAVLASCGYSPCGYKIGATNSGSQRFLGTSEPMFGPVFAERLLESGATFAPPAALLGIECEFGFRLGRNFPIGSETLSIDSIRSTVAECFPAIEIAGRRVPPSVPINEVSVIADLCFAVAVVRGLAIPHWDELDLCTLPVSALIDGTVVGSGDGSLVLGNPVAALLWLAEALVERGRSLRHGDLVVTGSCTGIAPIAPGQRVEARFGSVASVRLEVT